MVLRGLSEIVNFWHRTHIGPQYVSCPCAQGRRKKAGSRNKSQQTFYSHGYLSDLEEIWASDP